MVTIASFSHAHEAHIALARLEADGIPAFIADEHTITMQWLYSNALGGVKINVPENYVQEAREILSHDFSNELVKEQGLSNFKCKECGGVNTEFQVKGKRIAFIVFLALSFPFWPFKRVIKCQDCGAESEYKT